MRADANAGGGKCRQMPVLAKFVLNLLMHMMILTLVLVILFFAIITNKERSALQHEFSHSIHDGLEPMLAIGTPLRAVADDIPLEVLSNLYINFATQSDRAFDNINARTTDLALTLVAAAILIFTASFVGVQYSCGFCNELKSIALENTITFAIIGVVEYLFFVHFASQFVPTLPSFLITTIRSDVLEYLTP